ncbi:hypothetical protein CBR_g4604 [Chara braunii]|uniref:Serine aminopeptidase S33 domain-containing protein n=1 Tax=Chara braunii TaxID=69332 RepID=A0A388KII0_CHABU|nr:hypothetical protein CBR_g4604 [Chara braunii]|eukprot:GBG69773.1 hypothetical protein CBR_g4604 [Chara braunii]
MLHGYGNDISWHFQSTALQFANAGYATFAMDYEGHGRSDGLRAYMEKYENVVDDCVAFAKSIRERSECAGKPCFLYGESLGGGIALLIHKKEPHSWNGAVLVAPMCKISEKIKPPATVTKMLTWVAPLAPTLAVVPSKDVLSRSVKDLKKRELAQRNPAGYKGKPRLRTALEFLRMCKFIEQHMHEVNLPFLVLHGDADVVTDPEVSKLLHKSAVSSDKTIKIYHGMWHQIMTGEPDENVEIVFNDIIEWLDRRVTVATAWKKDLPDD